MGDIPLDQAHADSPFGFSLLVSLRSGLSTARSVAHAQNASFSDVLEDPWSKSS